jgi:hypothetical protein
LQRTYSSTNIRGDGPIVLVPFSAFSVEVIPAFRLTNGQYYVCMTDNGGRVTAHPSRSRRLIGALAGRDPNPRLTR